MGAVIICILLSILFGILTLVSVVFTIISFANSGKNKFIWLCIFVTSLVGLTLSVYFAVDRSVKGAQKFTERFQVPYGINDSLSYKDYNLADSVNSQQIHYLKLIEPREFNHSVPPQFYNYLGFRDYYRMPLRYPYSLHCESILANGVLYNEKDVEQFNVNDNGEKECTLKNVAEFTFDKNLFIAKTISKNKDTSFVIFNFSDGASEEFKNQDELEQRARLLQFSRPFKYFSCKEYYNLF
ncbi:MAG: hypothetical protein JWO32_2525 [Bacteroidetes bacterium]|nr:hypothetical protein [Bacteroidota bacterium]